MNTNDEPLLRQQEQTRYNLFPLVYPGIFKHYEDAVACFWSVREVNLSKDKSQWDNKLLPEEREFLKIVLAFFSVSDNVVADNALKIAIKYDHVPEIKMFYSYQAATECVHIHMYGILLETFVTDKEEQLRMFNAVSNFETIKKKIEWQKKFVDDENISFAELIVAFAVVEGIFFSGSFAAIFWLKQRGILTGLTSSNEFISKDEGIHCDFAVYIYSLLERKLSFEKVYEIITSAVEVEEKYFEEALPVDLRGMNKSMMSEYIKHIADRLCFQITGRIIYDASNPFPFMVFSELQGKTNFFERVVSEYEKSGATTDSDEHKFRLDVSF